MGPPRAAHPGRWNRRAGVASNSVGRRRGTSTAIGVVFLWGVSFYAVFGSVFWLPGIPVQALAWIKYAVFGGLLFLSLILRHELSPALGRVFFWLAATGLGVFVSLTVTSGLVSAAERVRDLIEPMAWLFVLSSIPAAQAAGLFGPLRACLIAFLALSAYPLLATLGWAPDFQSPLELHRTSDVLDFAASGRFNVSDTGFTGKRTGWGASVGLAAIALSALLLNARGARGRATIISAAVIIFALIALNDLGSRGALVALVTAAGWALVYSRRSRATALILLAVVVLLAQVFDPRQLLSERFWIETRHVSFLGQIDALSTGRVTTYISAVSDFLRSPFFGVGQEDARVVLANGQIVEVHNIALQFLAVGGLFAATPLLALGVTISGPLFGSRAPSSLPDFRALIVFSLVLSMIEPGHPIGSFQNTTLFWLGVWSATLGGAPRAARVR